MGKNRRNLATALKTYRAPLRFMAGWVAVSLILVALLAVALYRLEAQAARVLVPDSSERMMELLVIQNQIAVRLLIACAVMIAGVLVLAVITAHRMSGPYVAMKRTFDRILDGDKAQRLHFRKYDQLDDVEESFNQLMDKLTAPEQQDKAA
jgi:methyl-accepting chemotaxis protein